MAAAAAAAAAAAPTPAGAGAEPGGVGAEPGGAAADIGGEGGSAVRGHRSGQLRGSWEGGGGHPEEPSGVRGGTGATGTPRLARGSLVGNPAGRPTEKGRGEPGFVCYIYDEVTPSSFVQVRKVGTWLISKL